MFRYLKNIFTIFLCVLVIDANDANSTLNKSDGEVELQFNVLRGCLTLMGVDARKMHHRNSGKIFDELNWQWNTLNGYIKPLAYLLPTNVYDVQKAVVCCRLSKVRIVARSGGHSYVKNGFGDSRSLIVDLAKMNQIDIEPREMTCKIGAGALLGHISYTLWENGKFLIPGGICPTVGIAGLTLGGGFGRFTTVFGLTSDNVIEMEMVDANGHLLIINNSTNRDLFWALRGAGGGNFGIVTKFKFQMYIAPTSIIYGVYEYTFEDFSRFYGAWQSLITSDIPRHIGLDFVMKNASITMGVFGFNFHHQNETVTSVTSFIDSFPFPNPIDTETLVMSYADLLLRDGQHFSATTLTKLSQLGTIGKYGAVGLKKIKSIMSDKILNECEIFRLKELLSDYLLYCDLYAEPGGGAVNTFTRSDTAFVHRGKNMYQIQLNIFTDQNEPPNTKADDAMKTFYEKSKSIFNHHESYQNYLDQDIDDPLVRYFGSNLKRLVQIKRRVDPENVFHYPQSIPTVDFY